jgi:UDP-N-acetylglucosamine acyltransferase
MIQPSSIVSKEAEIHPSVEIGPFCWVEGKVRIDAGTRLDSHVRIGSQHGIVQIGKDNHFYAGCVVGGYPQDRGYKGEDTKLVIGNGNHFRECVTVSIGTLKGKGVTTIGSNNLFMAYVHFGHDCSVGDANFVANSSQFAGHCEIGSRTTIGGVCAFNQFVRVGDFTFVAGYSSVNKDVLPYTISQGNYAVMRATNKVGLERGGMASENVENIHKAVRFLIRGSSTIGEGIQRIKDECKKSPEIEYLIQFAESSKRGLAK